MIWLFHKQPPTRCSQSQLLVQQVAPSDLEHMRSAQPCGAHSSIQLNLVPQAQHMFVCFYKNELLPARVDNFTAQAGAICRISEKTPPQRCCGHLFEVLRS